MKEEKKSSRVVAIIQARMGSSRLPGKTLVDIIGKPLLQHIVDRLKASQTLTDIIIATTINPEDQAILDLGLQNHIKTYAGSAEDVLDRYYQAAKLTGADVIVRITADDPFKDPEIIDRMVLYFLEHPGLDYLTNTMEPSFPEGLDVEVFTFSALDRAWREAQLPSEREHVTPYIWKNPDKFKVANIKHEKDLSHMRWTLDYEEDLKFTREIYKRLFHGKIFLMEDILSLLAKEPELMEINSNIGRNIGYQKSLEKDILL